MDELPNVDLKDLYNATALACSTHFFKNPSCVVWNPEMVVAVTERLGTAVVDHASGRPGVAGYCAQHA